MFHRITIVSGFLLAVFILTGGGASRGAEHSATPEKRLPIVSVTQSDGSVIRGRLSASDPDGLTIQPLPKTGQPAPEQVIIPWKQIKHVSNGLTQAKALAQWKEQHVGELCETCHGDRTVVCTTCKGTGRDPAARKDCPTCHGEMEVVCKAPHCKEGKIPCPGHCIKRSEGKWVQKDGKTVRYFHSGKITYWVSEAHVGEVIELNRKTGQLERKGKCPICGGTTVIDCPVCHGMGKVPCPTCQAATEAPACPAHCDQGRIPCPTCDGTGLKKAKNVSK
jgi:hypothetical protein